MHEFFYFFQLKRSDFFLFLALLNVINNIDFLKLKRKEERGRKKRKNNNNNNNSNINNNNIKRKKV